jgi:hypothetical protein
VLREAAPQLVHDVPSRPAAALRLALTGHTSGMDGSRSSETPVSVSSVAWGYRRSRRIVPGMLLNVTKRGLGVSVGPRHAKVSANTRGRRSLYLSAVGFFFRKRI